MYNKENIRKLKRSTRQQIYIVIAVLVIIALAIVVIIETIVVHARDTKIASLNSQMDSSSGNVSDLQGQVSDLSQKLSDSKTQYNDLEQAVIIEAANRDSAELTSLYNACGPLTTPLPKLSVTSKPTPAEQQHDDCINTAQDTYIQDFISNNQ